MTVSETPAPKSPLGSRLTRFLRRHARGLLAALAVAGAAVALWVALREHEGVLIYRASAGESPRIRSEMTEGLHGRLFALRALARRSEIRPADEAAWKTTADSVLRLPLEFQGIQWLDPSLTVRRSMPAGVRLPGAPLDSTGDAIRIDELRALLTEDDPTVSRSFPLPEAPRQILMCAPLREGERVTGYLMGVLRATDLIDAIVRDPVEHGYSVQVTEGVFHVYGPVWLEGGEESTFGNESGLKVGDLDWKLMVWPSAEYLGQLRSPLVHLVLALGILLAILIGLLVDRLERWQRMLREGPASPMPAGPGGTAPGNAEAPERAPSGRGMLDRATPENVALAEKEETPGPI